MPSLVFKYIIIGDTDHQSAATDVGKSSLLLQYLERKFNPVHRMTIGVEYGLKPTTIKGKDIGIEIWDTAGQESYMALTRQYYRNSDGCLIVFDITRRSTFEHVSRWMEHAKANSGNNNLVITLVGNKADNQEKREVTKEEAQSLAAGHNFEYVEISAKDADAVEEVFLSTAERIFKVVEMGPAAGGPSDICFDGTGRIRLNSGSGAGLGSWPLRPGDPPMKSKGAECCQSGF